MVDRGLASALPPNKTINGSMPAWGCRLSDAEMGMDLLVRYANLIAEE